MVRRLIGIVKNAAPAGSLPMALALGISGLAAYGFLVLSAHALGPARYASLSVLWALIFLAAPGFFLPLEQEIARLVSAQRAAGQGGGPVLKRAAICGAVLVSLLLVTALIARPVLDRLFDEDALLSLSFLLALVAYCGQHIVRGALSGNGHFNRYALLIAGEGLFRFGGCLALLAIGVTAAGPYGIVVAAAPVAGIVLSARRGRGIMSPGPVTRWRELSTALGYLLTGSVLSQLLVNAGPIAVKLLATPEQSHLAGSFLAGLVLARIPLFLFQSVQAALLPQLAALAERGRIAEFKSSLVRLLAAVAGVAAVATVAAFVVGPGLLRFLFGPGFELGRVDFAYLAAASGTLMVAITLAQALIALSHHGRAVAGWFCGVVGLAVATAAGDELLLRVETGLLAGAAVSVAVLGTQLVGLLARRPSAQAAPALVEARKP